MAQASEVAPEIVPLWLIEPAVGPEQECWQDRTVWAEVVVAAESPAFARLAAEKALMEPDWTHVGNESESRRSGLNDAHLYHVRALPANRRADFPADIRMGEVLLARELRPPVQF
jgi:hypothetical protein